MSEMPPEGGAPAAGGFMSRKFLGIPAIFWLLGAAVIAFLVFKRQQGSGSQGATSTGGGGTSTTGDISIAPASYPLTINAQYGPNSNTIANPPPPRHRTPNPQPRPIPRPPVKHHVTTVKKPAVKAQYVTVAKWTPKNAPWNSTLWGIANHYHISLKALEALNPQVKNPSLIHPGEKIRIK